MHDWRMVLPAAGAWLVAAVAVDSTAMVAGALALGGVVVAGGVAGRTPRRSVVLMTAIVIVGVGSIATWRMTAIAHSPVHDLAQRRPLATLDAVVSRDARMVALHGSTLVIVDMTVAVVRTRTASLHDHAPITVFATRAAAAALARASVGQRFTLMGRLAPAQSTSKAAQFDASRVVQTRRAAWWWGASTRMRAAITESVARTGKEPSALIPALVHGDDQRLSDAVKADFRRTGLTHLLAVSGTNLTIVLVTMLLVGRAAGVRRRGQWLLGAVAVVGFIMLARPDPSVLRAAAMGSVGLAGLGFGSKGGMRALAWAIIALLMVDPWLSRSLGFILSVCATAGILLLGPRFAQAFGRHLPRWCAIGIAVPLAAQLACTPAIAAISGQVSLVAVLANVLAGPVVAPATILGLIGGVTALASVPASHLVGMPAGWCARWILAVGHQSAALPGASAGWDGPLWLLGLLCLLTAAAIVWVGARPALLCGLGLGLVVCMWQPPTPGWPPAGWIMVACDVGQGDAAVLDTGPGTAVVVDAGPDPLAVDGCLRRLGVKHIVLMVFTHGHADHIDGWPGVRRHRQVDQIMVGPTGGPDTGAIPRHRAEAGESFTVGRLNFEVLGTLDQPDFRPDSQAGSLANNASVVLRVTTSGLGVMMSGDAEPQEQDAILATGADVSADVLKMPHHGSARQSEAFFAAVGARVATISAGVNNDYGHPAPAALNLLKKLDVAAYRTDEQGDIAVVIDHDELRVLTR